MNMAWMLVAACLVGQYGYIEYPSSNRFPSDGTIYNDLRNHSYDPLNPWTNHGPKADTAHENAHGINASIRNKYRDRDSGVDAIGLYLGDNDAYAFPHPRISMDRVMARIPQELRRSRFKTYMPQAKQYGPLSLIEEWACYLHGARAALEDPRSGSTDHVFAPIEMAVYCVAVMMVVEEDDPDYQHLELLQEVVEWMIGASWHYYELSMKREKFRGYGPDYVADLRVLLLAKPFRERLGMTKL